MLCFGFYCFPFLSQLVSINVIIHFLICLVTVLLIAALVGLCVKLFNSQTVVVSSAHRLHSNGHCHKAVGHCLRGGKMAGVAAATWGVLSMIKT